MFERFHYADNPAVAICIEKEDDSFEVWTYVREPEETDDDVPDTLELAQALVDLYMDSEDQPSAALIDQCRRFLS